MSTETAVRDVGWTGVAQERARGRGSREQGNRPCVTG
jgi:hypothetical protein